MIRYRAELADAATSELTVLDGGLTLDVTNITEATRLGERRKFLENRDGGRSNLMRWPWQTRAKGDSSFTDSLVALIVSQASAARRLARPAATGALRGVGVSIVGSMFRGG